MKKDSIEKKKEIRAKKLKEIRVQNIEESLYNGVAKIARENKRTVGKQTEWYLQQMVNQASK